MEISALGYLILHVIKLASKFRFHAWLHSLRKGISQAVQRNLSAMRNALLES